MAHRQDGALRLRLGDLRGVLVFLLNRRPPSSPLFPYTTLFRSCICPATPTTRSCITASWKRASPSCRSRFRSARWHARSAKRSEERTSELQSLTNLVCRLLLEKKKNAKLITEPPQASSRCGMPY